jgi:putative phosphoribosyl transferase
MNRLYYSRVEAGRELARLLSRTVLVPPVLVVALPRGGVPVGFEVAEHLNAPLDILVVRKVGAPEQPELACGAVASGGVVVWNQQVLRSLQVAPGDLQMTVEAEQEEVRRREGILRGAQGCEALNPQAATVLLVDDGIATGATMKAAVEVVRRGGPAQVVVCVPVAPEETCREFEQLGCQVVCPIRVSNGAFSSVGEWYEDFTQVGTEECRQLLLRSRKRAGMAVLAHQNSAHRQPRNCRF